MSFVLSPCIYVSFYMFKGLPFLVLVALGVPQSFIKVETRFSLKLHRSLEIFYKLYLYNSIYSVHNGVEGSGRSPPSGGVSGTTLPSRVY